MSEAGTNFVAMNTTALVTGGTGTVGTRVATLLSADGVEVRAVGRRTHPPLHWHEPATWAPALAGVSAVFLLLPEAEELPRGFLEAAADAGAERVVLLSDRNAGVMGVQNLLDAQEQLRSSGLEWTIVRPDWFQEDFETFLRQPVLDGLLVLPVGGMLQDFVSADDIAGVAAAAMRGGYAGRVLDVTGPEALTFPEALAIIGGETGRSIAYDGSAAGYRAQAARGGRPEEEVEGEVAAFTRLTDHGDVVLTGTVEEVLGRPAVPFADYVRAAAARGAWQD